MVEQISDAKKPFDRLFEINKNLSVVHHSNVDVQVTPVQFSESKKRKAESSIDEIYL